MRTRTGVVAAAAAFVLVLGACGDDGGGSDEDALLDDPTLEECQDAMRTVFDRFEVPDGFDPSDGVDDDERAAAEAAFEDAAEGRFDPNDEDHPCNDQLDSMTPEETEAFIGDLDPEVIALLASLAEAQFVPIEEGEGL